jgi:hypothetical protein
VGVKISANKLLRWLKDEQKVYEDGYREGLMTKEADNRAKYLLFLIGHVRRMKRRARKRGR